MEQGPKVDGSAYTFTDGKSFVLREIEAIKEASLLLMKEETKPDKKQPSAINGRPKTAHGTANQLAALSNPKSQVNQRITNRIENKSNNS